MIFGLRFKKPDEFLTFRWIRSIVSAVVKLPVKKISGVTSRKLLKEMKYSGSPAVSNAEQNDLEKIFWGNKGVVVDKWLHYLPIYDRYFSKYRGKPVRFLEIGVSKGGSLAMWREYFGESAVIFGIDINPECEKLNGQHGQVRIGSQDDVSFLAKTVLEMGGVDIILDDGSHQSPHIQASFEALFPKLSTGGLYIIEDLHAAYWDNYNGGYDSPKSFMKFLHQMIDDMHHWYHKQGQKITSAAGFVSGLSIYDSLVVIEKNEVLKPRHATVGAGA